MFSFFLRRMPPWPPNMPPRPERTVKVLEPMAENSEKILDCNASLAVLKVTSAMMPSTIIKTVSAVRPLWERMECRATLKFSALLADNKGMFKCRQDAAAVGERCDKF